MEKGISPLIATVLIVAMVVAATGLMGPEILEIVGDTTEEATQRGLENIDCTRAEMYVREIEIKTNGEDNISLVVENRGEEPLSDFRLEVLEESGWAEYRFDKSDDILNPGTYMKLINESFNGTNGEEGRLITGTCPGKYFYISGDDLNVTQ